MDAHKLYLLLKQVNSSGVFPGFLSVVFSHIQFQLDSDRILGISLSLHHQNILGSVSVCQYRTLKPFKAMEVLNAGIPRGIPLHVENGGLLLNPLQQAQR